MTFTTWWNTPTKPKTFKRSDIEVMNRKNRKRRELQEKYDDERRKKLNANKRF
ncbi:MAG TPA: hypothetical protein H9767_00735 [Candidatus Nosocomiicoccus stercorigallinarum]|nr:hypothetical protein [Candidatus Nosocomiicoccus stercorigallinarum]